MTNKTREEFEARIEHHKELISIKEGRIVELEAERDQLREQNAALAAQLERLCKDSDWLCYCLAHDHSKLMKPSYSAFSTLRDTLASTPATITSLARIRAEAKAEALEDFRSEFELHCEVPDFILGCLEEYADEYRQKAEEGE